MEESSYISINIKNLRQFKGLTQSQLAAALDVKRSVIGSYEEGRAVPRPQVLLRLAKMANVSMEVFISSDITEHEEATVPDIKGNSLRILTTVIDENNNEIITLVPTKASAGYLNGYGDIEYIESLPTFNLPLPEFSKERTYRAFQIKGDSMKPIPSGAYIIGEYIMNWEDAKSGETYVFVTKEDGVVYKRLENRLSSENIVWLHSDNKEYESFSVPAYQIIEVWKAAGYISPHLPNTDTIIIEQLSDTVRNLQNEIEALKRKDTLK